MLWPISADCLRGALLKQAEGLPYGRVTYAHARARLFIQAAMLHYNRDFPQYPGKFVFLSANFTESCQLLAGMRGRGNISGFCFLRFDVRTGRLPKCAGRC